MNEGKVFIRMIMQGIRYNIFSGRRDDDPYKIHISSLFDFCPYRVKLGMELGTGYSPPTPLDTARAFTFKQGRKIQDIIVEGVRNEHPAYTLTRWVCEKCGKEYVKVGHTFLCPKCKTKCTPEEVNLIHRIEGTDFYISGSIDLLMGIDSFTAFEIKGLREEDFNAKKPIMKYVHQLASYIWLIKFRDNLTDFNLNSRYGYLTYISKKHNRLPVRLFKVKYGSAIKNSIEKDVIEPMKAFSKGKIKKVCGSKLNYVAKQCPYKEQCWGG